ncbi:hypothetical protein [Virgibacillus ainsalahensis]
MEWCLCDEDYRMSNIVEGIGAGTGSIGCTGAMWLVFVKNNYRAFVDWHREYYRVE